jgi:hypothetical protein
MAAQAEEPISAHIDSPHRSAGHLPEYVAAPIGAQAAAEALDGSRTPDSATAPHVGFAPNFNRTADMPPGTTMCHGTKSLRDSLRWWAAYLNTS